MAFIRVRKENLIKYGLPNRGHDGVEIIEKRITDHARWSVHYEIIFRWIDGKTYKTNYSIGATENQYEEPWEHQNVVDCVEVHQVEKTIKVWDEAPTNDSDNPFIFISNTKEGEDVNDTLDQVRSLIGKIENQVDFVPNVYEVDGIQLIEELFFSESVKWKQYTLKTNDLEVIQEPLDTNKTGQYDFKKCTFVKGSIFDLKAVEYVLLIKKFSKSV